MVYVVGSGRSQTWQHVYTAVTRGRNQVIIVARKSMLDWALEQTPVTRLTGLNDKLMKTLSLPLDMVTPTAVLMCEYVEVIGFTLPSVTHGQSLNYLLIVQIPQCMEPNG